MGRHLRFSLVLLLVSFFGATWLFWVFEHGVNPRIAHFSDVLWWWFVSSTTVGYGDIAPATGLGRATGVVVIIIGIYSYTNFIAATADTLHRLANQRQLGAAQIKATGHIVICEYTAFADELVDALPRYPELAKLPLVIVSELVQVQPYPDHHFVRGVPISRSALRQAAIEEAAIVFVFANVRFVDPDLKTLHIASRVRQMNPRARMFVELLDPSHEFVRHLDSNTTILPSRDLLESVLKGQGMDLTAHFRAG